MNTKKAIKKAKGTVAMYTWQRDTNDKLHRTVKPPSPVLFPRRNAPAPKFKKGDAVVLEQAVDGDEENNSFEYGRVVANRWNSFIGTWDVYVNFYGEEWPKNEKRAKPYMLRYFETSLEHYKVL